MLKNDVLINETYWTRISAGKGRVKVLRAREIKPTRAGGRTKTVFVCLNLATNREIERGAGALHLSENFEDRPRVQRTEVSPLPDLSGDPGHDMAERREIPPPPDTVTGEEEVAQGPEDNR